MPDDDTRYVMRVVGIDPSLRATGLALHDGELRTLSMPSVESADLDGKVARIRSITGKVAVAAGVGSMCVIEAPAFGMNNRATHELSGLWWSIVVRLIELGHEVVTIAPGQLKKLATGKGTAPKPDMRMALYQRAGLDVSDNNQVDAWWLRMAGLVHLGHPDALRLPQVNLAALDAVQWPGVDR